MPCCLEMSGASWNGIATPSWYFLMLLGDVSAHLDNISTAPCHAAKISIHVLVSFLRASWQLRDSSWLFLTSSFSFTPIFRSLQERPSLVKNNWETIKKPLRRCQEGPRSVQERARLIKESHIFWTCSTNFQKFLVLPTVQESSRSVKKCQELVTEVAKKYQDINFGTPSCSNSYSGTRGLSPLPPDHMNYGKVFGGLRTFLCFGYFLKMEAFRSELLTGH